MAQGNAGRIAALVIVTGLGLYLSLVAPALTMKWLSLPVGLVFLVAAIVLFVDILRRRRQLSAHSDADA